MKYSYKCKVCGHVTMSDDKSKVIDARTHHKIKTHPLSDYKMCPMVHVGKNIFRRPELHEILSRAGL